MPGKGTTNTPIRLTAEDRAKIEAVRAHHGLPTLAAVVRLCVGKEAERIGRRKAK